MNWIKENWFKAGLLAAIIVVALSMTYYYVIFLPQKETIELAQEKQQQLLRNQEKCRETGTKAYNDYKQNNPFYASSFSDPEFYFNETLQLCLYSGGYRKADYWERWVKNSFTDETIIMTYNYTDGTIDLSEPIDEVALKRIHDFLAKYDELFER